MKKPAFALALVALALAGCDEPAAPPSEQGGEAAGEVLGGSISDDMIPLEQLRSEAPPMPRQSAAPAAEAGEDAADEGEAQSEGAEAAPAAPAPETASAEE